MIQVSIDLDDLYNSGWVYTSNNTYYFGESTKMIEFIRMIIGDESNVGKH